MAGWFVVTGADAFAMDQTRTVEHVEAAVVLGSNHYDIRSDFWLNTGRI
ncbi:hypothetical protein [Paenibacillus hubeiensis]